MRVKKQRQRERKYLIKACKEPDRLIVMAKVKIEIKINLVKN